ncbi:rhomboid family intramembrane serine protease [Streptomyces indicus]|uniref:Membrane associated serine protease, rhomboid family n=1 Tax=Streptomyces indicus TaxID=417292 RepID=A0A1G9CSB7_9ACTN|nr:rhomboid family intramembrane serine protease [Streptomyces indicus]SDK54611.1 Membrane associated serine protease, rhomboid family [Streptomyces indicus]
MDQVPGSPQQPQGAPGLPGCYRHPDRETGVTCTRCERPICPECMISASVGFQCPNCVREGSGTGHAASANQPRNLAGGVVVADTRLVTKILVILNLAVFLAIQVGGDRVVDALVLVGRAWDPALGEVIGVAEGEWYRLFTSMFAQQDLTHIAGNMLLLWLLGTHLEETLGRARYLALYLISGLAGDAMTYFLVAPNQPSLGASGAVFGLLGATVVLLRRQRQNLVPIAVLAVFLLIVPLYRSDIAWQAHVGGLIAGAIVAYGMLHAPRSHRALVQWGTCAVVLLMTVAVLLIRTSELT